MRGIRFLAGLAAGVAIVSTLGIAPASASADTVSDEQAFVAKINEARAREGVAPLAVRDDMTGIARNWATQMAESDNLSHNPNLAGQAPEGWRKVGENVGEGQEVDSLEAAFEASPHHYANMIDPAYNYIGVGVVMAADGTMWVTENFLKLDDKPAAATAPAATPSSSGSGPATRTTTAHAPAPVRTPAPAPAPVARAAAPVAAPAPPAPAVVAIPAPLAPPAALATAGAPEPQHDLPTTPGTLGDRLQQAARRTAPLLPNAPTLGAMAIFLIVSELLVRVHRSHPGRGLPQPAHRSLARTRTAPSVNGA